MFPKKSIDDAPKGILRLEKRVDVIRKSTPYQQQKT